MLLLLSMGLYFPADDKGRIVIARSVFQNDTSQTGFQYQVGYSKIRPVKPVFVNEQDLFGITIKSSPNTAKFRQNITWYFPEKCLITCPHNLVEIAHQ